MDDLAKFEPGRAGGGEAGRLEGGKVERENRTRLGSGGRANCERDRESWTRLSFQPSNLPAFQPSPDLPKRSANPEPGVPYNPGVAEEKPKKRKLDRVRVTALLRDAWELVWRARARLLLSIPLLLINKSASIILPWMTKLLIDSVIPSHDFTRLWMLATVSAAAAAASALSDYGLTLTLGMAAQKSITELRQRIHDHVQRLPVSYFDGTKTGTVVSRVMNDAEGIRNLVGTGLVQLIGGIFQATVATAFLFYLSARLAAIMLGAFVVFGAVLAWAFNTARPLFRKRSEITASITGRLTEGVSGIRDVKAYRAERHESSVLARTAHELLRLVPNSLRVVPGAGAMTSLLVGIASAVGLVVGGREVMTHHMTMGGFFSFTLYLAMVVAPVIQIVSIGTQLSEAFAGLERMREILGEAREDAGDAAKEPTAAIDGNIELRDLWFEDAPRVPVLKGVDLLAPAGKSVAPVGPPGSGKRTLISLVAPFIRPTSRQILA